MNVRGAADGAAPRCPGGDAPRLKSGWLPPDAGGAWACLSPQRSLAVGSLSQGSCIVAREHSIPSLNSPLAPADSRPGICSLRGGDASDDGGHLRLLETAYLQEDDIAEC
jgi:hypothetical protein